MSNNILFDGVVAGLISAFVQLFIFYLKGKSKVKNSKIEYNIRYNEWQRNKILELIENVSKLRVPIKEQENEDNIDNAYNLIFVYFEISKTIFFNEIDKNRIDAYFKNLKNRYEQMIEIKSENEEMFDTSKRVVINEIEMCKNILLKLLKESKNKIINSI